MQSQKRERQCNFSENSVKSFAIDELGVAESDILEYVDDGVSGTHFKRQGFQQLQDDMKAEKSAV